jgi:hypothetical protein
MIILIERKKKRKNKKKKKQEKDPLRGVFGPPNLPTIQL